MSDPASKMLSIVIAKKRAKKNVIEKLRKLGADSEETAQKPKLTRDEMKAAKSLIKEGKIKKTPDGRLYVPKKAG